MRSEVSRIWKKVFNIWVKRWDVDIYTSTRISARKKKKKKCERLAIKFGLSQELLWCRKISDSRASPTWKVDWWSRSQTSNDDKHDPDLLSSPNHRCSVESWQRQNPTKFECWCHIKNRVKVQKKKLWRIQDSFVCSKDCYDVKNMKCFLWFSESTSGL